jgi:hypothetical protein
MGIFDDIDTVSIQFSNAKINHVAGDTITLDAIFDNTRNTISRIYTTRPYVRTYDPGDVYI